MVQTPRPFRGMAHFSLVAVLNAAVLSCLYRTFPQPNKYGYKEGLEQLGDMIKGLFWICVALPFYFVAVVATVWGMSVYRKGQHAAEFGRWPVYARRVTFVPPFLVLFPLALGAPLAILGPWGSLLLLGLIGYLVYIRKKRRGAGPA